MRHGHRLLEVGRAVLNDLAPAWLPPVRQFKSLSTTTNLIAAQQLAYNHGFTLLAGFRRPGAADAIHDWLTP
jgi:hypothetical protein